MKRRKKKVFFSRKYRRKRGLKKVRYSLLAVVLILMAGRYFAPAGWKLPWWVSAKLPAQGNIFGWQVPEGILAGLSKADIQIFEWTGDIRLRLQEMTGQDEGSMPLPEPGELTVDYLDVGQGDCALIQMGDHVMLFDCGTDDKGTYIQNYLQKQGIEKLDYVIGSHPDSDHIGGMDVVISKFDCETIFMSDFEKDTTTVRDVELALEYRGYEAYCPEPGQAYPLGDANFTVLAPIWKYEDDSNNNSIAIRLVYGENSFLFTGDAEEEEETDMVANGLTLQSDVYQVGHHGSNTATSWRFLTAVRPKYAVISCGANNDYGHPHQEVLDRLSLMGTKILRTDEQGIIRITSDGANLNWGTER